MVGAGPVAQVRAVVAGAVVMAHRGGCGWRGRPVGAETFLLLPRRGDPAPRPDRRIGRGALGLRIQDSNRSRVLTESTGKDASGARIPPRRCNLKSPGRERPTLRPNPSKNR